MFSPHVESQVKTKVSQVKRLVSWVYHLTSSLFLKIKSYLRKGRKSSTQGATLGGSGGVKNLDQWVSNSSS